MSRGRGSSIIPFTVFLAILTVIVPVSAYSVAIYGTNSGFNPDLHPGLVNVVKSIPGATGADLDANINQFTQPSVDVIILGGEGTFSPSTAAKIEAAVAGGKILIVTYPCNRLFGASLPASNGGTSTGGKYLEVSDQTSVVSKAVFSGFPTKYDLKGTAPDKEQAIANAGTITVLNYDTGMPALLLGKYGKGYVIEWTTVPSPSYLTPGQADLVLHRMIMGLLPAPTATQTTLPQITGVTQPVITAASPVQTPGSAGATSDVTIFSDPAGASIQIDGVYIGTTKGTEIGVIITGVPAGTHLLRLSKSGYGDYQDTKMVVVGQTNTWYGTLQPLNQITAAPTTAPTPVPTVIVPIIIATPTPQPTQDPGLLGNSSIIVAIIGVFTAIIAAGASIFTHVKPPKKE